MADKNRDISVITGIFIQNEKGQIWFGRMPKWRDKLGIAGGHVDRGETLEDGAKRELKEETGLDADTLEYVGHFETIDPEEYTTPKHFLAFCYRYHVVGQPEIVLNEEFSEGLWLTKEEAFARTDLNELTRMTLGTLDKEPESVQKEVEVEVNVDYKDKWLRAQADYSNLIKETAEKRSEWAAMSEWHILEEFIPVYDNFKKAFAVEIAPPSDGIPAKGGIADVENDEIGKWKNWKQGIGYIMKQFGDILKQHGIEEIETVGAEFDTNLHECLSEESSDEHEDGAIIREVNAGYKKGERVLKVAGVVLNKKK